MQNGPYILSIAGFDPCGGAGILADIKTIEAHKALGLGVCTSITYQNDIAFKGLSWLPEKEVMAQIETLIDRLDIRYVKIGLIKSYETLYTLLSYLRKVLPEAYILWDPILKASAGFEFHSTPDHKLLISIMDQLDLVTPNTIELKSLIPDYDLEEAASLLSNHCTVLLKGGHLETEHSNDYLFQAGRETVFEGKRLAAEKRGTGCVLSSAILANLSLGLSLDASVMKAKQYIEKYLVSSTSRLGLHHV
ncbi:MAG: hydroxymethylpyrimidine/phosphomethylpyrimidine kinase [Chitinophagaceae bacterium]|nr:hydroxymethylpyrimidine/phosphomethylpyrimidine kinase [Chitinophagaceae bacterium]